MENEGFLVSFERCDEHCSYRVSPSNLESSGLGGPVLVTGHEKLSF